MTATTAQTQTLSTKLVKQWEQTGQKLIALAEEFPAQRFDFKPAEDVRSGAEVLRHVAFWNQYVAAYIRGKKFDDSANELPESEYPTKARILPALKQSFTDAAAALCDRKADLDAETAEMLVTFLEHTSEHYGQLVVYARLNGITPPASRT
jgi:uncharacterized damage-inducible protein DinB